ncbi:hypothetical protein JDS93_22095 [Bacillus cereus group sp. N34]|uniref:hypothetical protein n=1 Tax=Bacillus cereus group sp. N34 TaxID=2794595 RepID=UPI0018F5ED44|nr:hypothetical protein [Bacillus cereus group sp. N34]MBJ8018706.1 hypothetical protein [Bacillus cereus group sp. N34]
MLVYAVSALLLIFGLVIILKRSFICHHYFCTLILYFCVQMTTAAYMYKQISLEKTIFIVCVLLVASFIVYASLTIIGFAFKHYTVFNSTSNRIHALMKEGLTEENIEFTVDKTNIYLCESPVKIHILNRPLHTTTIIFKKCTDEMASKLQSIIEGKIKEERSFPLSGVLVVVLGVIIFLLK